MQEKCCCGCCKLSTGTGIALTITAAEALVGLFCSIEIHLLIISSEILNPFDLVINPDTIDDFDAFRGIVLAAIGLNAFWFVFSIFAARGNIILSHGRLTPWILFTYLITLFNLAVSIYFCVKVQSILPETQEFFIGEKPTKLLTYTTLLVIFSGGGFLLFFNVFLAHVVEMRGKEIDHDYSVLALYLMSQLKRCTYHNRECPQHHPEPPPSYTRNCPPYLPPPILERANGSSGSSWSLSFEAINSGQPNSLYDMSKTKSYSAVDLEAARRNATGYQPIQVDTGYASVLPY